MYTFEYLRAQSVADAAKLLASKPEAKLLAGGHTLLPTMKLRLASPKALVDLGRVEALLPESEQVHNERYDHGARVKAVITEVRSSTKGPQVIVSRRSDQLVRELFKLEVPEMADGLVEIRGVAREPGWRSKIAVVSHVQGVDPVGACVGPRGSRVRRLGRCAAATRGCDRVPREPAVTPACR